MSPLPVVESLAESTDITLAQDPVSAGRSPALMQTGVPHRLGKYEILSELGEGGMGRVYKALDPELKRLVAIKVLKPNTGVDEIVRFRGEAEQIAMIEHANIIKVFDIAMSTETQPYIVLEYIDGGTLEGLIRKQLPKPRQAAELMVTLAHAMQAAHDKNIIHRDLKPANVLLTHNGTLKVSDFGLGKQLEDNSNRTQTGAVFGTPAYMAPEQASGDGKAATPATDIYALGAILYEMLTGRPPFAGAGIVDLLEQVQFADPASPTLLVNNLPRDISTICLKCLEKSPKARFASANDLAADLTRWLNNEPILARPTPWYERLWRRVRRRPKEALIAASIVIAIGAVVGLLWSLDKRYAEQEETRKENDLKKTNFERINARNRSAMKALNEISDLAFGDEFDDEVQRTMRERLAHSYHALATLNEQDKLTAPEELGKEFYNLAELFKKAGNLEQAAIEYQSAIDYYSRSEDLIGFGKSQTELGRVHCELGAYEKALSMLDEAHKTFRKLHESRPESIPCEAGLAEVLHLLGEIHNNCQRCDQSVKAFEKSIRHREEIVKRYRPTPAEIDLDYYRNVGRGYGYLGDVYLKQQKREDATRAYQKSHEARKDVVKRAEPLISLPTSTPDQQKKRKREFAEARYQLARSFANFANSEIRLRAHASAGQYLKEAEAIRKAIVSEHPSAIDFKIDLAGNYNTRAELCLMMMNDINKEALRQEASVQLLLAQEMCQEIRMKAQSVSAANAIAAMNMNQARLNRSLDPQCDVRAEADAILSELDNPRLPMQFYMRAAAYALKNDPQQALDQLRKARGSEGFRDRHPDDILNDLVFQPIRKQPGFESFVRNELPQAARPDR